MLFSRPSIHPLTPVSRDAISLCLVNGFQRYLPQIFTHKWELLKRFSRSEVKGQGHDQIEWCNGGGIHFDGVESRVTCYTSLCQKVGCPYLPIFFHPRHVAAPKSIITGLGERCELFKGGPGRVDVKTEFGALYLCFTANENDFREIFTR